MNQGKKSSQEIKMQGLIDRFLHFRSSQPTITNQDHLDEDYLNAFVEGTINERESAFVVNHLTKCSYCLHVTGDLLKLQSHLSFENEQPSPVANEPAKISEILSGLLSKVFGTNDGAVFAHQQDEEEDKTSESDDQQNKSN